MKKIIFLLSFAIQAILSAQAFAESDSLLNKSVQVTGFGQIRYREPVNSSGKFPILLVHGIYGGASHRTWREILPRLDRAGEEVYILDLPGVGESESPRRSYSLNDMDQFLETFITEVVKKRVTVVAESLMGTSALTVAGQRPDFIRRLILVNPTGVNSLNKPPSVREQALYDRLYNDEAASDAFYQNLLIDNSLKYFLSFGFYDDSLVNEELLADFRVARSRPDQKYLTLSFVGGQLYRSFEEASKVVFVPVLALFGAEYESFADNTPSKAADFRLIRPQFEYFEIEKSGSSVQREKPDVVTQKIIEFSVVD